MKNTANSIRLTRSLLCFVTGVLGPAGMAGAGLFLCDPPGWTDDLSEMVIGALADCDASMTQSYAIARDSFVVGQDAVGALELIEDSAGGPVVYADEFIIAETAAGDGSSVAIANTANIYEPAIRTDLMVVGNWGFGELALTGRSAVKVRTPGTLAAEFLVGRFPGSQGTATLNGPRAFITVFRTMKIGGTGTGTLHLTGGAFASANYLTLGDGGSSHGTLIVEGSDPGDSNAPSRFFANPTTRVGFGGRGELVVRAGGHFEAYYVAGFTAGGVSLGSSGQDSRIEISGGGSMLTCRAVNAHSGTIAVEDGGLLEAGESVTMGTQDNSSSTAMSVLSGGGVRAVDVRVASRNVVDNTITIDGALSSLEATGLVQIANPYDPTHNAHGQLIVRNSGLLMATAVDVGTTPSGDNTAGVLQVESGGRVEASTTTIGCNGVLTGTGGIVTGNIVVSCGLFNPGNSPGEFTIEGDYHQHAEGVLRIEIAPGAHDHVTIMGQATIGGAIEVEFLDGFVPQPNETFSLIESAGGTDLTEATVVFPTFESEAIAVFDPFSSRFTFHTPVGNGDFNGDESVTLDDFEVLFSCMSGPDVMLTPNDSIATLECLDSFDLDLDGDIDVRDYGRFTELLDRV